MASAQRSRAPEGTVLDLVIDDEGDDLTDDERALLHAEIERSLDSARQGRLCPAEDVLSDLDAKPRSGKQP